MSTFFYCPIDAVTTADDGVVKTLAALTVPDSAGNRCRVRALHLGVTNEPEGANAGDDISIKVSLERIADLSVGSAGAATAVIPSPRDTGSDASVIVCKSNYTTEPTTYDGDPVWSASLYQRGSIIKEWTVGGGPVIGRDALFGLVALLDLGGAAITLPIVSGGILFEEF